MKNRCTYGSINSLEKAVNAGGVLALYEYNGLGHRVGRIEKETEIHYTVDLTRAYHNLLQKEEEGNIQTFYWDGNITGMSDGRDKEAGAIHYYLQDELGSSVRVSGYDEFGNDLYDDLEEAGIPNPYSRHGEGQPLRLYRLPAGQDSRDILCPGKGVHAGERKVRGCG